jgi:hypothetical protein
MARRRRDTGPGLFDLRCEACGHYLVRTPSGYLACPKGHGKLQQEEAPEPCGSWFDEDDCGGAFDGFMVSSDADPGL